MPTWRLRVFAAVALTGVVGCATAGAPSDVFDDYFEAYAAGDGERLWELSSPSARADALRIQKELLTNLDSEQLDTRTYWEGMFGVVADDVRALDEHAFFVWSVSTIRRRLGVTAVRSLVSRIQRVREDTVDADLVVIVYRTGEELSRLPIARTSNGWKVDQSPFPPPPPKVPPEAPETPVDDSP